MKDWSCLSICSKRNMADRIRDSLSKISWKVTHGLPRDTKALFCCITLNGTNSVNSSLCTVSFVMFTCHGETKSSNLRTTCESSGKIFLETLMVCMFF